MDNPSLNKDEEFKSWGNYGVIGAGNSTTMTTRATRVTQITNLPAREEESKPLFARGDVTLKARSQYSDETSLNIRTAIGENARSENYSHGDNPAAREYTQGRKSISLKIRKSLH